MCKGYDTNLETVSTLICDIKIDMFQHVCYAMTIYITFSIPLHYLFIWIMCFIDFVAMFYLLIGFMIAPAMAFIFLLYCD